MKKRHPVLGELRDRTRPERYAIVDIVPTGSYEATLKLIGLSDVGFEGFQKTSKLHWNHLTNPSEDVETDA